MPANLPTKGRSTGMVTPISHMGGFSFLVFLNPWASILKFFMVFCRGCVSMGAVGAMAPTNFPKDVFGTHEISNSIYIGTSFVIDWHLWNFLVTLEWHPRSQIPNALSDTVVANSNVTLVHTLVDILCCTASFKQKVLTSYAGTT